MKLKARRGIVTDLKEKYSVTKLCEYLGIKRNSYSLKRLKIPGYIKIIGKGVEIALMIAAKAHRIKPSEIFCQQDTGLPRQTLYSIWRSVFADLGIVFFDTQTAFSPPQIHVRPLLVPMIFYDNAPMERYFNTLKNELIYHHYYRSEEQLYSAVSDFAFIWYNHIRPHSFNKGKTPFQKRCSA